MTTYTPRLASLPYDVFANPAASILLPIALGTTVGFGSQPKDTERTHLQIRQPPLRPPARVFGPAWTVLYGLMGYAAHRAVVAASSRSPAPSVTPDLLRALYATQLGLNLLWMPLFFGLRRPALALADLAALLGLNGYLARLYFAVDDVAAWCQLPYLAWLGFAAYLNAGVGHLNGWDISDAALEKRTP
ncbi:TspO/MBR-related protein [Durotheca rogersii]|uniref:TspO/MBR-related protein n=1 Tax=Durotheca rogersii TaxID=419775 RepID=UPI00221F83C5|nr:TspO/MBR-related protein [Durotheca rogersii]KAI5866953.1 TspO/MBR-related protein [Durotheca rogersii]